MGKKQIVIVMIIIFSLIMSISTNVLAATGDITFNASNKEVAPGETFTIIVKAETNEGICGISTKYTFDGDLLELQEKNLVDSSWMNISGEGEIVVASNSTGIKSAELYKLTFKVKESASVGSKAKVSFKEILLSTMQEVSEGADVKISDKEVEITVAQKTIQETKPDTTPGTTPDSTLDTTPGTTQETSTSKDQTTITTTKKNSTTSNTSSPNTLPKTGNTTKIIVGMMFFVILIGIGSYVIYSKKYRGIK